MTTQLTLKPGAGFALQPQNMREAMEMASMLSRSGMVPTCYKGKPEDTLVAMMMGSELGLNPIQALQNIAVINGKPSIYGDALMALVQNHPAFGGVKESFDESSMTASCTVWRKGGEQHTQSFSKKDAETAKLWGKTGPWSQYPKRMLQMRARGFAVRGQFADALAGLITREEAEDMPVERDVTAHAEVETKFYDADKFKANVLEWRAAIKLGRITPDEVIIRAEAMAPLTAAQKSEINNCAPMKEIQNENTEG